MIRFFVLIAACVALSACATPAEQPGAVLKDPAGPRQGETSFRFACEKAEIRASHSFDAARNAPARHTLSVLVNGRAVDGAQAAMNKIAGELVDDTDAITISVVRCPDSASGDGLGLAMRDGGTEWQMQVSGGALKIQE